MHRRHVYALHMQLQVSRLREPLPAVLTQEWFKLQMDRPKMPHKIRLRRAQVIARSTPQVKTPMVPSFFLLLFVLFLLLKPLLPLLFLVLL